MKIKGIPDDVDSMLYNSDKEQIAWFIKEPIVCIRPDHPAWKELDENMTGDNVARSMSRHQETSVSIHQIYTGHFACWIMDDYPYIDDEPPVDEAILINEEDLELVMEHGVKNLGWGIFLKWLEQ